MQRKFARNFVRNFARFFFKISVISAKIHLSLNVQVYTKFSKFRSKFANFGFFGPGRKKTQNEIQNLGPLHPSNSSIPSNFVVSISSWFGTIALSCWKKQYRKELVIEKDESPHTNNHGPSYCSLKNKAGYANRHVQSTKGAL